MTVLDSFRLGSDVALVTGAAGGIGGALAEAMAEAGADVAVVDIDDAGLETVASDLRRGTDATVKPIVADVTEQAETERMVEETVDTFGGLDVAFANAGIATFGGTPTNYDMDAWDEVIDVNLRGAFMTDRAVADAMRVDGGGSIINTASILGFKGTRIPGLAAYTASKGAIVQVTRQLAAQLGPHDIRVNAIAPGWIETAMTADALPSGETGDAIEEQLTDGLPINRLGQPADLKGAAVYLASEASAYTTGEILHVDGGMYAVE